MVVRFKVNSYYQAAGNVIPPAKKSIRFSNAVVTKLSFNQNYAANGEQHGSVQRKFLALPSSMLSIALMVANLAYTAFIGIPLLLTGNIKPLKFGAFQLARNGEIFAWRLLGIFNDRLSQYHIQKGRFNISCYSLSMQKSIREGSVEETVREKCVELIEEHYDEKNPQKIHDACNKTFKTFEQRNIAIKIIGEYAAIHKHLEVLFHFENFALDAQKNVFKRLIATLLLEKEDYQKVQEVLKGFQIYYDDNKEWIKDTIQQQLKLEKMEAVQILKKHCPIEILKDIHEKIAHLYCKQGLYDEAYAFVRNDYWMSVQTKEEIIKKCADHFLAKGDKRKAKKFIRDVHWRTPEKHQELYNIAEKHLEENRLEEAKVIMYGLIEYSPLQQKLAARIAHYYCDHHMHEKAVKMTRKILLLDSKTKDEILNICVDYYYHQKDIAKILEALSHGYLDFRENTLIKVGEKYLAANQIENVLKIVNHLYFYNEPTQQFFQKVALKLAENKKYAESINFCFIRIEGERESQTLRQIFLSLLKDPQAYEHLSSIDTVCYRENRKNPRDPFLLQMASQLARSGDHTSAKRAVTFAIRGLLLEKHFSLQFRRRSPSQELLLQSLARKLANECFDSIIKLLEEGNRFEAHRKLQDLVNECDEDPIEAWDGSEPDFNWDDSGKKIPKKVAKISHVSNPPEEGILQDIYIKCAKAKPQNYHTIFGLNASFTMEELKTASRKLLIQMHPDKNPKHPEAANEVTAVLNCMREALFPTASDAP